MTNTSKLLNIIQKSGLKLGYIAEKIGITYPSLRRKIYNESSFTQTEISILCELLKISSGDEIKENFFTDIIE